MTVEKPIPCSIYDIRGIQEWLDEMALQGLFLEQFNRAFDQASFRLDDPRPVRYRLDPETKSRAKDDEREAFYGEMGWTFVAHISRHFYVFSCDDPEAPELYSDPQSLSVAMYDLMRREVRNAILIILGSLLCMALPLLLNPGYTLRELLLWKSPQYLWICAVLPCFMLVMIVVLIVQTRRILNIRTTLAQGLPLKAKRRWNRPRFWMWYIPLWCFIYFFPYIFIPDIRWEAHDLDELIPSHAWPTLVQTEAAGPQPLEMEPYRHGYAITNNSWFAPIQEEVHSNWEVRFPSSAVPRSDQYWTSVRYVQARSPKTAELLFRLELEDVSETLDNWAKWTTHFYHITGSTGFVPLDWPGVDRLEVARYRQRGQDSWTAAVLRGTDILVVQYSGQAQLEDCLDLFLAALDGEEAES